MPKPNPVRATASEQRNVKKIAVYRRSLSAAWLYAAGLYHEMDKNIPLYPYVPLIAVTSYFILDKYAHFH